MIMIRITKIKYFINTPKFLPMRAETLDTEIEEN